MRRLQALAASLLCLALAACAAGQDPYTNDETRTLTASKRLLSNAELPDNCSGLTVAIKARIDRLKDLQKKVT
jgi:hypothetical protein